MLTFGSCLYLCSCHQTKGTSRRHILLEHLVTKARSGENHVTPNNQTDIRVPLLLLLIIVYVHQGKGKLICNLSNVVCRLLSCFSHFKAPFMDHREEPELC